MKIWKIISKIDNSTWLRYQYIIKVATRMIAFLSIILVILVLIFKAPEQIENFARGLSSIFVFGD